MNGDSEGGAAPSVGTLDGVSFNFVPLESLTKHYMRELQD